MPFVPFKSFGNPLKLNCDRDSQGNVYYADMSVSVVRPKCLENIDNGLLPQKWMGKKIAPIKSDAGFDLDFEWQVPQLKYWLKKIGNKLMSNKNFQKKNIYNKHNSFFFFFSSINKDFNEKKVIKKINNLYENKIGLDNVKSSDYSVLQEAINHLNLSKIENKTHIFKLTKNVIDEILSLNDNKILRYILYRFKYEIYPKIKKLMSILHIFKLSLLQSVITDVFFVLKLT